MLGRWFALPFVPLFPEAQECSLKFRGCSQDTAFRAGEWDVAGIPGFAFLGPVGNCSGKTNFFSLSSFAFVCSQLLPLNFPFPQKVLLSLHPFLFFPSSLPSFSFSPAPVHAHEEDCPFKHLISAVIAISHPPTTIEGQHFTVCLL